MRSELVGKTLGDYRLEASIGKGSMAEVFQAQQLSLKRTVAVKVLEEGLFTPHDNIRRFMREAEAMARLEHPHIVPIYAAGEESPYYYFAMRLIRGGCLSDATRKGARRGTVIRWIYEVCQALAFAHGHGVVHRDLKPSNILVYEGQAVLADFGLAHLRDFSTITQRGAIVGTPLYMSPEQTLGEQAGPASDCFSLGVILYEALLGKHPFSVPRKKEVTRIEHRADLFNRIQKAEFTPAQKVDAAIPQLFDEIFVRALAASPGARYADGRAMLLDLEKATQVLPDPDCVVKSMAAHSGLPPAVVVPGAASTVDLPPKASSRATPNPAQERFGRYLIRKELGHGGQGVVFLAFDPVLDRELALKVLQAKSGAEHHMAEMLAHEARVAAKLAHPHIIHIYDFGVEQNAPYLTMQYVNGPSLDRVIEKGKPLPLKFALQVLLQTSEALAYAHEAGVIHLDVKPGNILIARSAQNAVSDGAAAPPHAILSDFTMSAIRAERFADSHVRLSQRKLAAHYGLTAGTIPYASPEQLAEGDAVPGPASDIFSLGVVFYEMITGMRLFAAEHLSITQILVMRANVQPPSSRVPGLPEKVDELCNCMLARNVRERLSSMREVIALAGALQAEVQES